MTVKEKLNVIKQLVIPSQEDSSNDSGTSASGLMSQVDQANKAISTIDTDATEKAALEGQETIKNISDSENVVMESSSGIKTIRDLPKSVTEGYHIHPLIICMGDKREEQKLLTKNLKTTKNGLEEIKKYLS